MTLEQFKNSLSDDQAPPVQPLLRALWHDARGDWGEGHKIAQDIESRDAAWVHAYLHRKEGDAGNAAYWYGRANKPVASDSLEAEWARIATAILAGD